MMYNVFDMISLGFILFCIGGYIGILLGNSGSEDDAVKSGHAKYNEITRKFEWKTIQKNDPPSD